MICQLRGVELLITPLFGVGNACVVCHTVGRDSCTATELRPGMAW